jgi:hypothetical protein
MAAAKDGTRTSDMLFCVSVTFKTESQPYDQDWIHWTSWVFHRSREQFAACGSQGASRACGVVVNMVSVIRCMARSCLCRLRATTSQAACAVPVVWRDLRINQHLSDYPSVIAWGRFSTCTPIFLIGAGRRVQTPCRIQSRPTRANITNRRTSLRFGRIILVSLAPLLGLSALAAAMATGPAVSNDVSNEHKSNSLTRLLLSVVTPMAESSTLSDRAERPCLRPRCGIRFGWSYVGPSPPSLFTPNISSNFAANRRQPATRTSFHCNCKNGRFDYVH